MVWNYVINEVFRFNQNVMKVDDYTYECDSAEGFELIVGLNTLKQLESE